MEIERQEIEKSTRNIEEKTEIGLADITIELLNPTLENFSRNFTSNISSLLQNLPTKNTAKTNMSILSAKKSIHPTNRNKNTKNSK